VRVDNPDGTDRIAERPATREITVVFWPWGGTGAAGATLLAVLSTIDRHIPVVLPAGDLSSELLRGLPAELAERIRLGPEQVRGFASFVDSVASSDGRRDLVVLAAAWRPRPGWLDGLLAAAASDDLVAIATVAWTGVARTPLPQTPTADSEPDQSLVVPPPAVLVPHPAGSLIKAETIDLVGKIDATFTTPAAVLTLLAARAREAGQYCVLAGTSSAPAAATGEATPDVDRERTRVEERHQWLAAALASEEALDPGPLRRALVLAQRTRRLSVTIDARGAGAGIGGSATYITGLVMALARSDALHLRACVAPDVAGDLTATFGELGVELVRYDDVAAGRLAPTELAHRPQQIFTPSDLQLLNMLGERIVVTQLDLIGYRCPEYHPSVDEWNAYRRSTRLALAAADQVVFPTEHARRDAETEQLVDRSRTAIAGIGLDVPAAANPPVPERPARLPEASEFVLMLGSDYAHKNRPFAIRLMRELRARHGVPHALVFAGAHVPHGSSAEAEAQLLHSMPELRAHVIDLGPVSEAEKQWLVTAASAHLAPSLYEGFGLAPLEAAAVGRPCLYAAWTAMRETIDPRAAVIVPWDPVASAAAAGPPLLAGDARDAHIGLLRGALARHTWDHAVPPLLGAYENALASPYRSAKARAMAELEREELLSSLDAHARAMDERARALDQHAREVDARVVELDKAYRDLGAAHADLHSRVSFGLGLIDARDGVLSEAQQRALMRLSNQGRLSRPFLTALEAIGSVRIKPARAGRPNGPRGDDGDS
jgi:glycosyltransferase involved in cell wall biosynthesis